MQPCPRLRGRIVGLVAALVAAPLPALAVDLTVTTVHPPINGPAPIFAPVRITFDRAVMTSTINGTNIRVFGRNSGPANGTFKITEAGRVVTFTPNHSWSAGEVVQVNVGEGVHSSTGDPLAMGGFAW